MSISNDIMKKIEQEDVSYVSKIRYRGNDYIKCIKVLNNGIDYVYYKIDNNNIEKIEDTTLIDYFKEFYGGKASNILY